MQSAIIPKTESITIEFKTSFNEDVIETLVAFSNAKGGTVYVGISDKGEIKGVHLGNETIPNWVNEIKNKTAPQIIPDVEILIIDNKTVVGLFAMEYPIKPVSVRGRYYKRTGNSNHLLSVSEVSNMNLQTVNSSWDYYPRPGKSMKDISLVKVQKVIDIIKRRNPNNRIKSTKEFLLKYELVKDDGITNACFLMFCKEENLFTTLQMGLFASETVIKDDVTTSNDILTQVEEVMSFVIKHINKEIIISGKVENTEHWQYPIEGIREIVLNMIIHRDYTSPADSIVKVFADHILFFNPGSLPDSITIEQLLANNYVSTPRNRQIAKTVKEMGMIERYGTGIKRVRRMFTDYGLLEPHFETIPGGFAVTVFAKIDDEEDNYKDREKVGEKVGVKVGVKLTDNQLKILENISLNPSITASDLAKIINISNRKIEENISKLKLKELLVRKGPDKGGYWEVINEEKNPRPLKRREEPQTLKGEEENKRTPDP